MKKTKMYTSLVEWLQVIFIMFLTTTFCGAQICSTGQTTHWVTSSAGGVNPNNSHGAIDAVGSAASTANCTRFSSNYPTGTITFANTIPSGTTITLSLARDNSTCDFDISDGTNTIGFLTGTLDEIQHISFVTGQSTNSLTITRYGGAMFVDGAGYCESNSSTSEICDNGIDDDGDGFIDCNDPDCLSCVIATDDFDYASGTTLHGSDGGAGFSGPWDEPNGSYITVESNSLTYSGLNPSGNKVSLESYDQVREANRQLENTIGADDEFWVSFLLRGISVNSQGLWFKPGGSQTLAIGKRWGTKFSINNTSSSIDLVAGQTYWVVAKYVLSSTSDDEVYLWINPSTTAEPAEASADATLTANAISTVSSVQIGTDSNANGSEYEVDLFRITCDYPGATTNLCLEEICDNGIDDDGDGAIDEFCSTCPTGSISFERWNSVSGVTVTDLTNNSNYPNNPDETGFLTQFQGPFGYGDNYGTRVRGYLHPTETGPYQFTITSDDESEVYLSTDGSEANKALIASVPGWTNVAEFTKFPEQVSGVVNLVAGANYYIELLHKEGGGGDHFQVYWTTPSNSTETIIPGANLSGWVCCSINAGNDETICYGASTTLNTTPDGDGNYSFAWSPTTGLSSSTVEDPIATLTTTTTYTVTVTDGTGCVSTDQVTITVDPQLSITAGDETICLGETTNIIPSSTGAGPFSYDWGTATTTGDALTVSPTATTDYVLTVTDANNCTGTESVTVTVNQLPAVILNLDVAEACEEGGSITLSGGLPINGTYSGDHVSGTIFDVIAAGVGSHTVTYTHTDSNGCTDSATQDITVHADPSVNLTLVIDVACDDIASIVLGGGFPSGGTYSGPFVSGITFDVSTAGAGLHTVSYTYENATTGCENIATDVITINAVTSPTFILGDTDFCVDGATYTLIEGSPAGGVYTGNGVSDPDFDPSVAGLGPHTLTYTFTTTEGCIDTATEDIMVHDVPTVTFVPSISEVCETDPLFTFDGFSPAGGTFSGPGVVNGNQLDPSALTSYSSSIVYTYTDTNGCMATASADILLNLEPVVTNIIAVQPSCEANNGSITFEFDDVQFATNIQFSLDGGATWETMVADNSVSVTYSNLAPATYDLRVRISNGYCPVDLADVTLVNQGSPTLNVGSDLDFCETDSELVSPVLIGGTAPYIYAWTGPNGFVAATLDINVDETGIYTLLITDANNCTATDDLTVTLLDSTAIFCERYRIREDDVQWGPWINFTGGDCTIELCENEGLSDINFDGGPETSTGWVWTEEDGNINNQSVDNIVGWNDIDASDSGTYSGTYTNPDGCISTLYFEVVVHSNPTADAGADVEICENFSTTLIASGGDFYIWDDPASTASASVTVTPAVTTTYTVTVTDVNGCVATDAVVVTVNPPANVQLNETDTEFCTLDATVILTGGTPAGGTYSGNGVTGGVFDPTAAGLGTHTITYEYENGCIGTATQDFEVFQSPTTTLNLTQTEDCEDSSGFTLDGGLPAGGQYSGTGVSGNYFDITIAGQGVHTITYTYTDFANGCVDLATQDITIHALPSVTLTLTDDQDCVTNTALTLGGGSPVNGQWSGLGVTGDNFDASMAQQGTHTMTYTFTDGNGCTNFETDEITVIPGPNVNLSLTDNSACDKDSAHVLDGGTPSNGTFSGPFVSATNNTFDAAAAGTGTHTVTYTFTDNNGCTDSASQDITVYSTPETTLSLTQTSICESEPGFTLDGGLPANGQWSGPGVGGDYFNVVTAGGPGTYTITYTFIDFASGCEDSATQDVEVFALPTVTLDLTDDEDCVVNTTLTLDGVSPANGIWSGPGVSGSNFDASDAGVGTHTITYSFTDTNGCMNSAQDELVVLDPPNVWFSLTDYNACENETAHPLDGASPANGIWSGPGVTGATLDATVVGPGPTPITYTFTDANGCANSQTQDMFVDAQPAVSMILPNSNFCFGDDNIALTGGTPADGIWSGTGVSGSVFNTTTSGLGTFTITYTYTDLGTGCENAVSQDVTVFDKPVVTLSLSDDEGCITENTQLLEGASPANGIFSGPGVTGDNFDASAAGIGDHTITYTFIDDQGCSNDAEDIITVYDIPVAELTLVEDEVCENGTLTLEGGSPAGGTWSGPGVTGNTFDPMIAGAGTHTISYEFNVSSCNSAATDLITVHPVPVVELSLTQSSGCYGPGVNLEGGSPLGGVYSGPGVNSINGRFSTTQAGVGTHTVTYTYQNANGCEAFATQDFTVWPNPVVTLDLPQRNYCVDNTTNTLSGGSPANGTFSGPGVSGSNFDASDAGVGPHTIAYTVIDENGCENTATQNIRVRNVPNVSLELIYDEACPGDAPEPAIGGWPLGGMYSGPGVVGNTIDPTIAGVGQHVITYTVIGNSGCLASATDIYEVYLGPTVEFNIPKAAFCIGESDIVLSGGTPTGGYYEGPGVNTFTGLFNTVSAGIGTHTLEYFYEDSEGCTGQATVDVMVHGLPSANLTLIEDRVCATDANVMLAGGTPAGGTWSGPGVSGNVFNASSLGAGTYTVTYTYLDANGCAAEASDIIRVDPIANATFTHQDENCNQNNGEITFNFLNQSDIFLLEFSINNGISWREVEDASGSTTFSSLSTGTYDLLVRNEVGTCEISLGSVDIQNLAGPTADAGADVTILASASTQLNGSGGGFYQWSPSTGLSNTNIANPIASPSVTTTYTLTVTDVLGCRDTDEVTVIVIPPCAGTVGDGDFPYSESFETGIGLWSQGVLDDFDWSRGTGATATALTGPTSGSDGSWYMYTEATGHLDQTAIFNSPCFDLDDQSCAQFTFDYHMYGNSMGSLSLEASINFGNSWTTVWTRGTPAGDSWQTEVVDMFGFLDNTVQLRFVGDTGSGDGSDMAIDNVEFITTGCGCDDTSSPYVNFALVPDPQPFSIDIDGDGDADMLAGGDGELFFFRNNGDGTYTDLTGTPSDIMPNLTFLDMTVGFCDLDGDGDYDMSVVGNEPWNKFFFWNTGSATNPIFTQAGTGGTPPNPISGFDLNALDGSVWVGYADATIFWVDLDYDGDFDAIVGGKLGWFHYYENTGSATMPNLVRRFNGANPFNGLRADGADEGNGIIQYESSPFLIDWDGDGDFDMFSGNQISTVQYFENIGSATNPIFVERTGADNPFDEVIFSEDSHIVIIDEDCDGDWDVFYGVGDTPDDAEITLCDLLVSVPNFAAPGSNQSDYCIGQTVFLSEQSTVGVEWNWEGPNGFTSNDQNPIINDITEAGAGTYSVTVTNEQGCDFDNEINITVSFASCDAGPDFTIELGESVQLQGSGVNGLTFNWSPSTGLSNPNILNPIVTPSSTVTYTLTVTNEFGCSTSCEMTINVLSEDCEFGEGIFYSDMEDTTGDNFWMITNGAFDGNFLVGVPDPYVQSGVTVMELPAYEGSQALITGNNNYSGTNGHDLDGGPTIARSRNIVLPADANDVSIELYWYFSHFYNSSSDDYLIVELRDASNNNTLESLVNETGVFAERGAVWTLASADLTVHTGKTVYIYVESADLGDGSKVEAAIDNVTIEGLYNITAALTLPPFSPCEDDEPIMLSGGTPAGGTYSGPGVTGNMFDPAAAIAEGDGPYIITYEYTNVEGCLATTSDAIEVFELPFTEINLVVGDACETELTVGLFGGTPTGGVYSGPGVSGSSFSPAAVGPGTYPITYTVMDDNGCENAITADFIVHESPIVTNVSSTNTTCGQINGTITIEFSDVNGIDDIQFSLDNGNTWQPAIPDTDGTVTYTDLPIGDYDLWVIKSNGDCAIDINDAEIVDEPGPLVDAGLDQDLCSGGNTDINAITVSGTAPLRYEWSGPNGFIANTLLINVADAGTYVITVTDANDCTSTDEIVISTSDISMTANLIGETCYGESDGRIIASASLGNSPYTYTIPGQGSNTTGVFNNLPAGYYEVTVVDNLNCQLTRGYNILGAPQLTCIDEACVRASSVVWTGSQEGPWTSTTGTVGVTLSVAHAANTRIDNASFTETLTTANSAWFTEGTAGGSALGLQFAWDDLPENELTDIDELGDDKGTATFTLTFSEALKDVVLHVDKLGSAGGLLDNYISNSSEWTITTPGVSLIKLSGTDDLEVTANKFFRTPDVSSTLDSEATQTVADGTAAGSIAIVGSSAVTSIAFEVTGIGIEAAGYDAIELSLAGTVCTDSSPSPYGCDGSPGAATFSGCGGIPPYSYSWSNGETTSTAINLTAGTHTVVITDAAGCEVTCSVDIIEDIIVVDAGPNLSFCVGEDGALAPSVTNGEEPYDYEWTYPDGSTSVEIMPTVTEGGTYTLVVTDVNGCTGSDIAEVYAFECDQTSPCHFLHEFNTLSYYGSDGTESWSDYSWDESGDNNSAASGDVMIFGGVLMMENNDSSPPSIQRRVDLTGHSSAILSFEFWTEGTLDADDEFIIEVFDGNSWTTVFTYNGSSNVTQIPWLDISAYINANTEIRMTIISGFEDSGERLFFDNIRIDVDCLCEGIADAGIAVIICEGDSTQLIGSGGVSYSWAPASDLSDATIANPFAFPTQTTTYTLTVTDENGCTDEDHLTITVNENVLASVIQTSPDLCQESNGEATVTVTQGNAPYTISWQTTEGAEQGSMIMLGDGSYPIPGLNGGTTYCIHVTDANGCAVEAP